MIQDIAPHQYDNRFRHQSPQKEDFLCCIRENQTLLVKTVQKNQETGEEQLEWNIPTMAQMEEVIPEIREQAEYLFSIDQRAYFLLGMDGKKEWCLSENRMEWKGSQYFRTMEPMHQSFAAVTAAQLFRWRESRIFCGHCGCRMEHSKTERALICPKCGQIEYPKISPAVIVAITNGDKLLMSRYRDRPYRGYALIAGFVEIGETFEETVRREVMEEVGLKVKNIRYFKSQPWAFTDTEMIGFFAELDGDDTIRLEEDELSEAGWYTKEEIPDDPVLISVGSEMKMAFKHGTFK